MNQTQIASALGCWHADLLISTIFLVQQAASDRAAREGRDVTIEDSRHVGVGHPTSAAGAAGAGSAGAAGARGSAASGASGTGGSGAAGATGAQSVSLTSLTDYSDVCDFQP